MTDKDLKRIYMYMGWCSHNDICRDGKYFCVRCWKGLSDRVNICSPLDSNTAWECVQEMERKDESESFDDFYQDEWLEHGGNCPSFTLWASNPDNFFNCMAKWLEVKHG